MLLVAVVCVFSSCKEYILLLPPHCHGGEAGSSATVDVEVNLPEDYTGPVPEMPKLMPDANNMIQRPLPSAMPAIPGMLFQDIYEDPECTIPVNFPVPYSENQKYYARYVSETPSVRFLAVLYPGNTGEEVTLPEGFTTAEDAEIDPSSYDASATGYKFVAWYKDRNCTEVATTFNAVPGETTLYAMFVQSEVEMTEGPNGEEIIPITYTAVVDDPTDVHYEVQSISGGDEDLYIVNTINGFPVDIAANATQSVEFNGNANVTVRNIGQYAFYSSTFGEKSNEYHEYIFKALKDSKGNGGNLDGAFNNTVFGYKSNSDIKLEISSEGVVSTGGVGFMFAGDGRESCHAELILDLNEVGNDAFYPAEIFNEHEGTGTAEIKIKKATGTICTSVADFAESYTGDKAEFNIEIEDIDMKDPQRVLENSQFGDTHDEKLNVFVTISVPDDVSADGVYENIQYKGCKYFEINEKVFINEVSEEF